jgi:glycosyltransferase involved in cell wall biosynthesis
MGAPAARVSELAQHWTAAGHDVQVLTGFPNHPDGIVRPEYRRHLRRLVYRENIGEVKVLRSWLLPFPNRKAYERILNYSSFCASAAITGSFLEQPEVVIASSPQLLVGLAGWWTARLKRSRFVLEVRDLWPESLAAVGAGEPGSSLYWALSRIAGFLYRQADHIVVVTPAFREYLTRYWQLPAEKISVVTNGVETKLFAPRKPDDEVRQVLNAQGRFVVSFIGTLGVAHGLEALIGAAERLETAHPDILFAIVGDGAERERLVSVAREKKLSNVRFMPQQPHEKIPGYIAASDVCLTLLKKSEVFETVIPTKMLEFMSCAKPVIVGVGGQAKQIVEHSRAGICIEPENVDELCKAILKLRSDAWLRDEFGKNGREYIRNNFSRERTAVDYLEILARLTGQGAKKAAAAA